MPRATAVRPTLLMRGNLLSLPVAVSLCTTPMWLAVLVWHGQAPAMLIRLLVCMLTAYGITLAFARIRRRPVDRLWIMHGQLIALLMPYSVPLLVLIYSVLVGLSLGALVYGGSGRYIVSPTALAVVLAHNSYPADTVAMPLADFLPDIPYLVRPEAIAIADWSLLLSTVGLIGMLWFGIASLRVTAAALFTFTLLHAVAAFTGAAMLTAPGVTIAFIFCLAFLLSDPSCGSATPLGRWLYGSLFAVLFFALSRGDTTVLLSAAAACFAANLAAPLIDYGCTRWAMYRLRRLVS